ncbi:hypothetical protein MACK_003939 [Theileria orientalis]|uniref:Uncharacterized protein n=1 Tax=Theileria orientalis TaxID=68886 RepID=A0A976SJJ7_THEOR|nr:hypothetical protein MACK_003939 [Theileria orientalis]
MKIDTISTYILVYLLTCVRINVFVTVKAEGGQTSSSSQRAETQSGSSATHTSTPKNGVDLNIKSDTKTTNKYDYKKVGEYVTYTAKDNNAFKLVKDDKTEVWKATDSTEYSTKVEVEHMVDEGKAVTIYLDGNKTRLFKKDKNHPWNEIDTYIVITKGLNIDYCYETHFYKNELKNNVRKFTTRVGFAFNVANEYINNEKVEIWKTDKESEYANKIEVDLMNNDAKAVTICFPDNKTKVYKKDCKDDPWSEIDTNKVNDKSVNIMDNKETYFYSNKLDNDVRTFEAKNNFAFKAVKEENTDIWTTTNESEYANKVVSAKRHSGIHDVTIHLVNKKKKLYIKESDSAGSTRTFEARDGFAFSEVNEYIRDKKVEIWKTNKVSEYVKRIEIHTIKNDGGKAVTIYFAVNKTKLFIKSGKNESWTEIDTTEENTKSVNIQDRDDTYFYTNKLDNNVRTFEARHGFTFNAVKEENTDIWATTNESEYANKVVSAKRHSGILDVTIHSVNKKKKLYIKESDSAAWKEIDLSQVNARSMNIRYDKETYFYSNKLQGSTRTFEARDGFAFNEVNEYIRDKKVEIWKTTIEKEYSKKVVAEGEDIVAIYMGDATIKAFKKRSDDNWSAYTHDSTMQTKKTTEPQSSSTAKTAKTFTDLNITSYTESTDKFDYNKDNTYVTYTAKDDYVFNVVKEGNTEVWKAADESNYSGRVEVDLMNNDAKAFTVYLDEDKTRVYTKSSKNGLWTAIDTSKVNPMLVNIHYQYDSYYYTNKLDKNVRTFKAKYGFAFNGFREGDNNVWTTANENEYANKVVSIKRHSDNLDVTIHLIDGSKKLFIKETGNDQWTEIDTTKVNTKSVNIESQHDSYFYTNKFDKDVRTFEARDGFAFNGFSEGDNNVWTTANENEYANKVVSAKRHSGILDVTFYRENVKKKLFIKESDSAVWKEIDLSIVNPNSVNIGYEHDSYFYTNELDNNVRTFTAKTGFAFNAANKYVNNNKIEIWKTDYETEYANKLVSEKSHSGILDLTIHLVNGGRKLFINETDNEPWKEIDVTIVNPKSVNIEYQYDSHFYTNKLDKNVRTFKAKYGFAFNGFREGDNNVWTTNNESEYAKKIEVDLMNNDSKAVTFYLDGNKTKLFMKCGKNESWTETDTSKINRKLINIDYPHDSYFFTNKLDDGVRTFETKTGFGFECAIKYINNNKIELWKADNEYEYANKVVSAKRSYGKLDLTVYLDNGKKKIYIKESDSEGWKEIDLSQVNARSMNIRYDKETYFYSNKLQGSTRTFEARDGFAFSEVNEYIRDKKVEIWKTTNENEFSKKVVAKGDNKVIIYTGDDGNPKVFIKASDNKWKEDTAGATTPDSDDSTQPEEQSASSSQSEVRLFKANPSDAANPLELDANEYTYTQSGNVAIYHINVDCVQLMLEGGLLWVHDTSYHGGIYPKSVYHDTSTDILLLRFEGLDITFQNTNEGWVFTESGPLAVKFYVVDPNDSNKTVELASNQLTVSTSGDVTTFNIAEGVNSIALTYGPALLWQHDPSKYDGKYPRSLYYSETNETLVLRFDGLDLTFANNDQGQWEYTETDTSAGGPASTPPAGESSTQSQVKLFKANPSDAANPLELDANEYTYTQSGNVAIYHINVDCVQLMLEGGLLWVHDTSYHGGIYPKSVYHDTSTDILLLRFEGLDITFQNTNEGWVFTESGPLAVKFYVVDPNDSNNSVELDSTQLTSTTKGDVTTFNIAEGVNSIALMYGSVLLWQHDQNQHDGKYPKSLDFTTSSETLVLRFDGLDLTFANNDQGQWEYTETDTSAGGPASTPPAGESSTQSQVKLFKANPSDAANPLELDANEYTSTQSGNVVTYQIAGGVNCVQLMLDNLLLWAHDSAKNSGIYPKLVYHDTSTDVILLRFEGLDITFAKNTNGDWVYTESGPLAVKFYIVDPNDSNNSVELDSTQLTISQSGEITTFNIAEGVNSIAIMYGSVLLWQHDQNQHDGKHPRSLYYSETNETLVLRFDGLDLTFTNNDQGQWEYTETDTSAGGAASTPPAGESSTQSQVKLFKANPSDAANPLELDANEYTSTQSGNVVTYQIAGCVKCVKLMFDNLLLWAHDSAKNSGIYPKLVYHDTSTDVILLRFEGLDITFAKNDQGQWEYTETDTSGT